MKIIVCVKQVPDTTEVRIDKETNTLIREGVPSILNPDDANALEQALQLKDKYDDVTVTVLSMGPPQADVMLRECLAMGADEAVLLTETPLRSAFQKSPQNNPLKTIPSKQEDLRSSPLSLFQAS